MKINKCMQSVHALINACKLACNLYDKKNCIVHIRSLKQALDHGLILKKVQNNPV